MANPLTASDDVFVMSALLLTLPANDILLQTLKYKIGIQDTALDWLKS